jgi:hydrogenase maturation protease
MKPSILVAGVGNIFLGDDGFGVEVALALRKRPLPEAVCVKDFGIRGLDLAYALLDPWQAVILVDALPHGAAAGTLYIVEPNLEGLGSPASAEMAMNPHGMDPVRVLILAASMGPLPAQILVLGCEPQDLGDELEGRMGLSAPVLAAVEPAANLVAELIERILTGAQYVSSDVTEHGEVKR